MIFFHIYCKCANFKIRKLYDQNRMATYTIGISYCYFEKAWKRLKKEVKLAFVHDKVSFSGAKCLLSKLNATYTQLGGFLPLLGKSLEN